MQKKEDTCISMFIAALFTVAKIWKQPKCPSTGEWIKKMQSVYMCLSVYIHVHAYMLTHTHTHSGILLIHKNRNAAIYNNMDQPRGYYAQ